MTSALLTFIGLILGIIASTLVGRHYFRRTIDRSLKPFIHLHSLVLSGIDPSVRGDLKVRYKNEPVDDLTHLQLLVANTGTRAIRDCIKPFSISFPQNADILDYSILYRHPSELELTTTKEITGESNQEAVNISFPLLNKDNFFLIKFLIKGTIEPKDLKCKILVDDLPPTLDVDWLPRSATTRETSNVDWSALFIGVSLLAIAACMVYLFYLLWNNQPSLFPYPWSTYEFSILNSIVFLMLAVGLLILIFIGIVFATGIAFEDLFSSSRHRFQLPDELQPPFPLSYLGPEDELEDNGEDP